VLAVTSATGAAATTEALQLGRIAHRLKAGKADDKQVPAVANQSKHCPFSGVEHCQEYAYGACIAHDTGMNVARP